MGIELPAELRELAAETGVRWPAADEDRMRASARAWRQAGRRMRSLAVDADTAASSALAAMDGPAGDAARRHWNGFVGPDGHFAVAGRGALASADRLSQAATTIGEAKVEIVNQLVALAQQRDAALAAADAGHPEALATVSSLISGAATTLAGIERDLVAAVRIEAPALPVIDPATGAPAVPLPESGPLVVDGLPIDPATGLPVVVDPVTGLPIDPATGLPVAVDPETGLPVVDSAGGTTAPLPVGALPGTEQSDVDGPTGPVPGRPGQTEQSLANPAPVLPGGPSVPVSANGSGPGGPVSSPVPVVAAPIAEPRGPRPVRVPQPSTPVSSAASGGGSESRSSGRPGNSAPPSGAGANTGSGGRLGAGGGTGGGGPAIGGQSGSVGAPAGGGQAGGRSGVGPGIQPGQPAQPGQAVPVSTREPAVAGRAEPVPVRGTPADHTGAQPTRGPSGPGDAHGVRGDVPAPRSGQPASPGALQPPPATPGQAPQLDLSDAADPGDLDGRDRADGIMLFAVFGPRSARGSRGEPCERPASQLPPPGLEVDYAAGLRFGPADHPNADLVDERPRLAALAAGEPAPDQPTPVAAPANLTDGYDDLAGLHERDWDHRFVVLAGAGRPTEYAWPPAERHPEGGTDHGEPTVLAEGELIDRFGCLDGRVFAPTDTPFERRSLPPELLAAGYTRYVVLRPMPVWWALSAPWFGQLGGAPRYRATSSAAELVALGMLAPVREVS